MDTIKIASLFGVEDVNDIKTLDGGHINRTYLVTASDGCYVLQSLNREVFAFPEKVMGNISAVEAAFVRYGDGTVSVPHYLEADGANFVDADGEIYRMYSYTESSEVSADRNYLMGRSFGAFLRIINSGGVKLHETIHDFRDFGRYYSSLSAVSRAKSEIFTELSKELEAVFDGNLPKRNVHNDAKSANIITGRQCTVIDLDTSMEGYAALDFGDMIRSVLPDMSAVRAVANGFAEGLCGLLTSAEVDSLYYGILWAVGELSMRYYIDGIAENGYFKGKTPVDCIRRADELYEQLLYVKANRETISGIVHAVFSE